MVANHKGSRLERTFNRLPQAERYVTLQNGTPILSIGDVPTSAASPTRALNGGALDLEFSR